MIFRRINLKTIKRNPDAGRQVYFDPGPVTRKDVWGLGDRIETRIRRDAEPGPGDIVVEVEEKRGKLPREPRLIRRIEEREVYRSETIEPEPDFLFDFEKISVRCMSCKKDFDYDEIAEDEIEDDDGLPVAIEVCPLCEATDPLDGSEVRDEKIEEALKRLSKEDPEAFSRLQ